MRHNQVHGYAYLYMLKAFHNIYFLIYDILIFDFFA